MTLEEFIEKYGHNMNPKEIDSIEDSEIRSIKSKYWKKCNDAFLDEHGIPDSQLWQVFDRYYAQEKKELEEYYNSKYLKKEN